MAGKREVGVAHLAIHGAVHGIGDRQAVGPAKIRAWDAVSLIVYRRRLDLGLCGTGVSYRLDPHGINTGRVIENRRRFLHEAGGIGCTGVRDEDIATAQAKSSGRKPGNWRHPAENSHKAPSSTTARRIAAARMAAAAGARLVTTSASHQLNSHHTQAATPWKNRMLCSISAGSADVWLPVTVSVSIRTPPERARLASRPARSLKCASSVP